MEGTLGEVKYFAGTFAPRGWAFCQGELQAISSNQALLHTVLLLTEHGQFGKQNNQINEY